jgi:hypothetical protein
MYKAVEMAGRFLYRFSHVIVTVEIEDVRDQVKGILIVLNFRVKACQVETIGKVILVNLAEVLIAAGRNELWTKGVSTRTISLIEQIISRQSQANGFETQDFCCAWGTSRPKPSEDTLSAVQR